MQISLSATCLRRAVALVALLCTLPAVAAPAPAPLSADQAQEVATNAYIYAYPLVLMEVTRQVMTNPVAGFKGGTTAPMNQLGHARAFPDEKFDAVVRSNADTLFSFLWYDVSREPLLISVPDSGGRFFLLPMLDMWSDVFASAGSRTTGTGAQTLAIMGPDWQGKLPDGVRAYRSPTAIGWMIGRTQTNGVADYAAVHPFQDGLKAVPLSAWGKPYTAPVVAANPAQDMSAPVEQVAKMEPTRFYSLFAQLLKDNPPHAHDAPILDQLARLGFRPGENFDLSQLSPEHQAALKAAVPAAQQKIIATVRRVGTPSNGWRMALNPIGTYGTDYLRRAVIAYAGLGANVVEDAIYPVALTDADGKPFDSAANYSMHFAKEQLPPVRAFWSLTLYNDRQFFAANPIKRFAIGDRDKLQFNADGSLDLYIQREAPEGGKRSNWLPTPASGGFTMNLRLYWPKANALDGGWAPPPVQRLD